MATIRAYTTIEQSRKLAEILPLESADMYYPWYIEEDGDTIESGHRITTPKIGNFITHKINKMVLPCWSLAALINILPNGSNIVKEEADTENEKYMCTVGIKDDIISTFADNPIDACYEMILKLNELNLL